MPAIPYMKTGTSDSPWDGPGNVAKLSDDADASVFRKEFCWVDGSADEDAKGSYVGPHHFVGSDGQPGAASTVACSAMIAVLNGGRGGSRIPDSDRQAVYAHVSHHLRDAGKEVPELKSFDADRERRMFDRVTFEVRAEEGSAPLLRGHAAVFNQLSDEILFFREKILPGAFGDAIRAGGTYGLWNHNPDFPLANTDNGTLRLAEDAQGLQFEMELDPDVSYASDLLRNVRSGRVSKMSFGFTTDTDNWHEENGDTVRDLVRVGRLFDVSPVVFPAYPQTQVSARAQHMAASWRVEVTPPEEVVPPVDEVGEDAAREAVAAGLERRHKHLSLIEKEI